jgi:hypothetical protein
VWKKLSCAGRIVTQKQYNYIRGLCEWAIKGSVGRLLTPDWRNAREELVTASPGGDRENRFSEFALWFCDQVLAETGERASEEPMTVSFEVERDLVEYGWLQSLLLSPTRTDSGVSAQTHELASDDPNVGVDVTGSGPALHTLLVEIGEILARGLPNYDFSDLAAPFGPDRDGRELIALAEAFATVGYRLLDSYRRSSREADPVPPRWRELQSPIQEFGGWVRGMIQPQWKRFRDDLIALSVTGFDTGLDCAGFMQRFLGLVATLLNEGLKSFGEFSVEQHYSVPVSSWQVVLSEPAVLGLELHEKRVNYSRDAGDEVLLGGKFSHLVSLFELTAAWLVDDLSMRRGAR